MQCVLAVILRWCEEVLVQPICVEIGEVEVCIEICRLDLSRSEVSGLDLSVRCGGVEVWL